MALENKKFKCKSDFTLYTLGPLQEDGYHNITWTHEDGSKDADKWRGVTVDKKFESGDWYYVNPVGGELADVVGVKGVEVNPTAVSALDKQVSGNHYKDCKIQPVEYIQANNLSYLEGNVIKYTTRHSKKNGKADILKAIHYLELILEFDYKAKV